MDQPLRFEDPKSPYVVCKLHKALYGLKQVSHAWFKKLTIVLHFFGFISAKSNQSFIHSSYISLSYQCSCLC